MADQHFRTVVDVIQRPEHTEILIDTATPDPEWVGEFVGGFIQAAPNLFKPRVQIVLRDFRGTKPE